MEDQSNFLHQTNATKMNGCGNSYLNSESKCAHTDGRHKFEKITAIALVTSVGAVDGSVASSIAIDTLAAATAELVRPAF